MAEAVIKVCFPSATSAKVLPLRLCERNNDL
ncbi:MAG: hypothetical protein ACI822_002532, partial [Gammaproteobacteria bacterium]